MAEAIPSVIVIDDDSAIRESIGALLRSVGLQAKLFASVDVLREIVPRARVRVRAHAQARAVRREVDAILPATGRKGLVSEDNRAIYAHFEVYQSGQAENPGVHTSCFNSLDAPRDRFVVDSGWRKTDSNLCFRISRKRFFYAASEPQTGREPQPVLTTDNGRLTVGRARLAPAIPISIDFHPARNRTY
jgi:hypothetical protein